MISIIMPTLNAVPLLPRALPPLIPAVADGLVRELILADGGSTDLTRAMGEEAGAIILSCPPDRAAQRAAGAAIARGDWLLFLDPRAALAPEWSGAAHDFIQSGAPGAGVFRLGHEGGGAAWLANARAAWFNAPRAEQGLLIRKGDPGRPPRVTLLTARVLLPRR